MLNCVELIGRQVKDPELKQAGENVVMRFTIAVNRDYKDKDGNYPCDFIDCEVWNQGAQFLYDYSSKGDMLAVKGTIRKDSFESKDGDTIYRTYINADRVYIVNSKSNEEESEEVQEKPKKGFKGNSKGVKNRR